ncbi:MAG TPA: hypothetical protein VKR58_05370 [Aquella sp.]|nr:hypothetical protein [Aquella sp.]
MKKIIYFVAIGGFLTVSCLSTAIASDDPVNGWYVVASCGKDGVRDLTGMTTVASFEDGQLSQDQAKNSALNKCSEELKKRFSTVTKINSLDVKIVPGDLNQWVCGFGSQDGIVPNHNYIGVGSNFEVAKNQLEAALIDPQQQGYRGHPQGTRFCYDSQAKQSTTYYEAYHPLPKKDSRHKV